VQVRLGDPRVVPCFRVSVCIDMLPSETPGSSAVAYTQFLRRWRWPSSCFERLGTSKIPQSDSRGAYFRSFTTIYLRYDLSICLPPVGSDRACSANQGFYFRASDELVSRFAAGYGYSGNWASSTGGTSTRKTDS